MKLGINLFVDSLPVNSTPKMTVKRIGPLKSIFKYNRLSIKVIHMVYNLYGLVYSAILFNQINLKLKLHCA